MSVARLQPNWLSDAMRKYSYLRRRQFSRRSGRIDMPLKSEAVEDLDITAVLPFSKGIVQFEPDLFDTVPVPIIKLNNLARTSRHTLQIWSSILLC
jgi:hypothetical protein